MSIWECVIYVYLPVGVGGCGGICACFPFLKYILFSIFSKSKKPTDIRQVEFRAISSFQGVPTITLVTTFPAKKAPTTDDSEFHRPSRGRPWHDTVLKTLEGCIFIDLGFVFVDLGRRYICTFTCIFIYMYIFIYFYIYIHI